MTIGKMTKKIDEMGNAWAHFKNYNERRINEIERKGSADALTMNSIQRLNDEIDSCKSRNDMLETANSRPAFGLYLNEKATDETILEHRNAFISYVRKGVEGDLVALEKKALSVGTDADGGYLVTPQVSNEVARTIFESSPMRKLASVQNISSDSLDIILDNDEAGADWAEDEDDTVSDTDTPQIGKANIVAYELVAQPKATQKLIDDSSIDIEKWLTEKLAEVFSRKENTAFISGDGSAKPKGILSYAAGTGANQIEQILSGTSAQVTADGLVKLYYGLKDEYAQNATFLMNRSVVQAVRLLKEATTNQYLWQPGLALGTPDTLMGVPVMMASDMPVAAANSLSVAVGDFKRAYQIVDRTGIRILRDPYTEKPFVKFYTTKRVGGQVINHEAIKLMKLASA